MIDVKAKVSGRFRLEAIQPDGTKRFLAEFDNIVLDSGLDMIGTEVSLITSPVHHLNAVYVGTGASLPNPAQTKLDVPIGRQAITLDYGVSVHSFESPPYNEWSGLYNFAFGAFGPSPVNITEIGIGPSHISPITNAVIFSRALIVGGGGVIAIQPTEALSVTFFHRLYPPEGTVSGTVTVNGIPYDYDLKAAFISGSGGAISGTWMRFVSGAGALNSPVITLYPTQDLGLITGGPTPGTGSVHINTNLGSNFTNPTYVNGNFYHDGVSKVVLVDGNIPGGWGSGVFNTNIGTFQIAWDPKIPKDEFKQYTFTYRYSWTRV